MNTFTICRKELIGYFRSPIGYGVVAWYALVTGFFLWIGVEAFVGQYLRATLSGQSVPMSVDDWVIRGLLSNVSVYGMITIPFIAMRLFPEEKRSGTFELLRTSPIRDVEIIAGKWLGAVALYGTMLVVSLASVCTLYLWGRPTWRPLLIAYLGLLLQGGAMLSVTSAISSCTRSQMLAAAGGVGLLLMMWIISWASQFNDSVLARSLGYLSITDHFENFSKGLLDFKDAVYFLTLIIFGLFLTARSLESMRWRA